MVSDVITLLPGLDAALRVAVPKADAETWARTLSAPMQRWGIISKRAIAAFLGQTAAEAGVGYQETIENLTYLHADRLCLVFPHAFPDTASATAYLGNPELVANTVYALRLGNGGPESGDGWRFRGRGLLQLTGRDEYTAFAADIRQTAEQAAHWCETPAGAAESACWFWSVNKLTPLAEAWDLAAITLRVNGRGMVGFSARVAASTAALKALGG
jgi:putative chitinase